jgi:hypothetical protein
MPVFPPVVYSEGANSLTFAAAAADDAINLAEVPNGEPVILRAKSGATGATITIAPNASSLSMNDPSLGRVTKGSITATLAANSETDIEIFPVQMYRNAAGNVPISYSALATITRAAFRVQ